eukprot:scaffold26027_cov70-Attheya_sp.AAC.4
MRCCCRRSCYLYSSSFLFVALLEEKSEDGGIGLCKEKSSSEDSSRERGWQNRLKHDSLLATAWEWELDRADQERF